MMEAAQPKLPTEEQLLEMGKMFPNLDKDIISSVFVEKSGSQEEVINVLLQMSSEWIWVGFFCFLFFWYVKISLLGVILSIRDGVLCSGMLLYLHHIDFKIFFHPAKFDNFKDEKISDFKTVSVSQRKNLLDWKLVV